ncbi:MAG TPA: deoxyribodipyrimidine photolyase, partial [Brevundimonas sp.]|nr:deoxyribodipyrimidine photolyase [Brevundimonas sp.]
MRDRIAIIGAGLAGLAAGRALAETGMTPVIFEKSRGLGGRLATRRTDFGPIDHGAPGVPASVPGGGEVWHSAPVEMRQTGLPGISALARAMSGGLDIRKSVEVQPLIRAENTWRLS